MKNTPSVKIMPNGFMEDLECEESRSKVRIFTKVDTGRWRKDEHELFLKGLQLYGRDWKKIEVLVGTRTGPQIRSHAQKYFNKINKEGGNNFESMSDNGMVTPTSIHSQDIPMRIDKNEENKSFEFQSAFTKVNFKNKIDQSAVMSSENKEVMNKLRLDIPPVDFDYALPIPSLSAENSLKKEDDLNEKCFPSNSRNKSSRMYTEEEVLLLLKYIIKEFASIMNKFCAIRQPSLINCLNLMNLNSLVALSMIAGDQNQIGGISSQGSNVAKKNNKLDNITSFANFQNCEITNLLIQNLQNNQGTLNGDESIDKIQKLSDWIDLDLPNLKSSSGMVNPSQSNKINSEKSELNLHKAGAIERRKTIKLYDSPIIQSEEFDD